MAVHKVVFYHSGLLLVTGSAKTCQFAGLMISGRFVRILHFIDVVFVVVASFKTKLYL